MVNAYPLSWPAGYPRTEERQRSNFNTTPGVAIERLIKQVELMAGKSSNIIISSNVPLSRKGTLYADMANDAIYDPGVAVYFFYEGEQRVICCDE